MNLWFRLIATLISSLWKPALSAPLGRSRLRYRVWPTDLDINFHVNNGRYLTLMDQGRMDLIIRSGMLRPLLKRGWIAVLTSTAIRYRHELRLFEPFYLESSIVYWQGSTFVFEHRIRFAKGRRAGKVATTALVKGGIYDRKERAFVSFEQMAEVFGFEPVDSPPATPAIKALLATDEAIRVYDKEDDPSSPSS